MPKTIVTTLFHCIILTPIFMMPLFISPPLKSLEADKIERDPEVVAISNWQVFNSCRTSLDEEDENKEIAGYICRLMFDAVYEANQYHTLFTDYFEEKAMDRELDLMEVYSMTGCDINEMEYLDMKLMYIDYIEKNEDVLGKSFYRTMTYVLEPYCQELMDASIEFYLQGSKT